MMKMRLIYTEFIEPGELKLPELNIPVELGELEYDVISAKIDEGWFVITAKERRNITRVEFEYKKVNPETREVLGRLLKNPKDFKLLMKLYRTVLSHQYMQALLVVEKRSGKRFFVARTPFLTEEEVRKLFEVFGKA